MIRNGHADCVLVVACDSVTEFIFSGFSSLMALDSACPAFRQKPGRFERGRGSGVCAYHERRTGKPGKRPVLGTIAGWGLSDDANHMTGPSRESEGLILAIEKAFFAAGWPEDIGLISAHGTGTMYNDPDGNAGFSCCIQGRPRPVYSVKGGIGHTMGAAGLVEMIIALRSARKNVPPTVNLKEPDADAAGWVSETQRASREVDGFDDECGFQRDQYCVGAGVS